MNYIIFIILLLKNFLIKLKVILYVHNKKNNGKSNHLVQEEMVDLLKLQQNKENFV
jgi:hypothetical protein